MALSVIGAGFGRTGTMSLKLALEQIGFGPCHHMEEVFARPDQLPIWEAAVAGDLPDWDNFLESYRACVDWPSTHFWREIYEANPGSKVILPQRVAEDWWDSYAVTIMTFVKEGLTHPPGMVQRQSEFCKIMIGEQCFGSHFTDRAAGIAAYRRRAEEVRSCVPADCLLEFNLADGWRPLCDFLDVPVPMGPFPRTNARADFFKNFDAAAIG